MSLINWLGNEATGWNIIPLAGFFLVANLCYAFFISYVVLKRYFDIDKKIPSNQEADAKKITVFGYIIAAFIEELIFRFCFLFIPIHIWGNSTKVLIAATISSFVFGILHGSFGLIIQSVSGFSWCLLFLKCGGLQHNFLKALTVVTIVHFLYNISAAISVNIIDSVKNRKHARF